VTAGRTLAGSAVIVLLALAGATGTTPAGAATAAAPAQVDPVDKPSHDPRPCHGKNCPTDPPTGPPTATDTPGGPPTTAASGDPAPPGTAGPPAPGQVTSGAPAGGAARPGGGGAPGQPGGTNVVAPGSAGAAPDGGTGTAARPAAATKPVADSLPLWPILWGGTALIALVTAGLLVILRDRRIRPDSGSQEPDQGVPSPSGPIRMEWVEPDG
jgi:hypothetical protein